MSTMMRGAAWIAVALLVPACTNDPTVAPAKGDFDLSDPANGAIGVSTTPTFDWQDSFSVESPTYTIQVSTDPGFSSFAVNQAGLTTPQYTPTTALSPGTLYYWQVLAVRSTGSVMATGAPWSFTTLSPTPAPFTMIGPANTSMNMSVTPLFSWNVSTGAATYTLQVSTSNTFATTVINQTGLTTTSFTPTTPLNVSTPYFWQVIAVSTNNTTATGAPWAFTTGPTVTVTLSAPSSGATAVSKTPTFSWSSTGSPATYTLQVSTDNFNTFAVNQSGILNSPTTPSTTLAATTTYSWRIEAFDSGGNLLSTSSAFSFTTGP